ncbi:MAG: tetratricopeptide repeat protein, partial [Planctomycetota bacterium]
PPTNPRSFDNVQLEVQTHYLLFSEARTLAQNGDLESARAMIVSILNTVDEVPRNGGFFNDIADFVLLQLDDADEAMKIINRSIQLNPQLAISYATKGQILESLKHYSDAVEAYRKAIDLGFEHVRFYTKVAMTIRYHLPTAQANELEVIELLKKGVALAVHWPAAHDQLARVLANARDEALRDPKSALEHAEVNFRWLSENDGEIDAYAFATLGMAQYRVGQYEQAIGNLTRTLDATGDPLAPIEVFLAMAYWQLGNKEQAAEWFSRNTFGPENKIFGHVVQEASLLMGLPIQADAEAVDEDAEASAESE